MAKSQEKKCQNYFFKIIPTTMVWWNAAKIRILKQWIPTESSPGTNDGFSVLWGIFKEYIKENVIMAVSRKANSHPIVISRLIKNINNVKEDPGRKTDSNFNFSQATPCSWGFKKRNIM